MTPDERVNEFVETMMSVDLAASPVIAPSARAPRETCPECGGSGKFAAVSEREEITPDTQRIERTMCEVRAGKDIIHEALRMDQRYADPLYIALHRAFHVLPLVSEGSVPMSARSSEQEQSTP